MPKHHNFRKDVGHTKDHRAESEGGSRPVIYNRNAPDVTDPEVLELYRGALGLYNDRRDEAAQLMAEEVAEQDIHHTDPTDSETGLQL